MQIQRPKQGRVVVYIYLRAIFGGIESSIRVQVTDSNVRTHQ